MLTDLNRLTDDRGFVTRPEIIGHGYDDRVIAALLKSGDLRRIGVGLYAGPTYSTLRPEQQHLIRCHAVATRFIGEKIVFSHHSAALLHGAAVWGVDLETVHVTRLDGGRGRRQGGVAHHVATLTDDDIIEIDGLLMTNPARTTWDIAVRESTETGIVVADSMLHLGLTDDDALLAEARDHASWRRARHAKLALTLSDGLAESVGESRTRYLVREFGLPEPELQVKIFDGTGRLIGIADFGWRVFRHLAEFDGLMKYASGRDLAREKWREDAIRQTGWGCTRIVWSQLARGQRRALAEHLREAMRESQRQFGHLAA